ncbi:hypothetical protein A9Q79_02290 [Methylophaga sp. 42_25_T18]|nr:hypothetical protein A9Q79_02290 [Methylophaga sp. 42_25_T18]OUR87172.1 hypothetical protein A9Q92_04735 [Methylophaga sp. 42_8_T64]
MYIDLFTLCWFVFGYILYGHKVMFDSLLEAKATNESDTEGVLGFTDYIAAYGGALIVCALWPVAAVFVWREKGRLKRLGLESKGNHK